MRKIVSLSGLLVLFLALAGCGPKFTVPPVAAPPTGTRLPGKFVWFDLFTGDAADSAAFYESLFGWKVTPTGDPKDKIRTISGRGRPMATLIERGPDSGKARWLSYLSVPDVDRALDRVRELGGSVHRKPMDMDDRGRVAIAVGPQNAAFGLITSSSGDPADTASPEPSMWLGSELWTTDEDAALAFYTGLANYEVNSVQLRGKVRYSVLLSQGRRRGGIVEFPGSKGAPEWVPFIEVDDAATTVARARKLGGKVLVSPDLRVAEGRMAIIEDPAGAVFGIQQVD
jgi:predicted enzyme related to lactoylglutathione lyase